MMTSDFCCVEADEVRRRRIALTTQIKLAMGGGWGEERPAKMAQRCCVYNEE